MKSTYSWGIGSGLGVVAYVTAVAWLMSNAQDWLTPEQSFFGPILFLLVFVLSAAVTGTLVFGRPAFLALQGDRKRAFVTLGLTLATIVDAGLIIVIIMLLL